MTSGRRRDIAVFGSWYSNSMDVSNEIGNAKLYLLGLGTMLEPPPVLVASLFHFATFFLKLTSC